MSILIRIAQAINQNKSLQRLYHRSLRIIDVQVFYLVRENLSEKEWTNIEPKINPFDVVFLKPSEVKVIADNIEVPENEAELLKRITKGCLCIGIKHYDEIAAYMWCDLKEIDSKLIKFRLKENEARLMDARTFKKYRGKNLAPYLRIQLYKYLRRLGKTEFISITSFFNSPALNFKKKLNAEPLKLYVWIKLFMKYDRTILLKRFKCL